MTPLKANELRKGNLFDYHGQIVHVMDIVTSGTDKPKASFGYFIDSIGFERFLHHEDCPKPLPLTPELLERFGFKSIELGYEIFLCRTFMYDLYLRCNKKLAMWSLIEMHPETEREVGGMQILMSIESAHILQNFCHSFTGNELTLKQ